MDLMFRSMTTSGDSSTLNPPPTPNFDNVNKKNEMTEMSSKMCLKGSGNNSSGGKKNHYEFVVDEDDDEKVKEREI
jgi:hypothetical protein